MHSLIGIDTTYNIGNFFVTPTSFRNIALQDRRTKKSPIFLGSVMIHYRCDGGAYSELLTLIKKELGDSVQITIGSDGDKGFVTAVKDVYPNAIHLYCTRHVKKNIERHLLKTAISVDHRRRILDSIFDSPDSLIQAETEQEYDERLNQLRDICSTIDTPSNTDGSNTSNFYTWFLRYQNEAFQNHLIAAVRLRACHVDHNGSAKLFYNNDAESLNHVLKNVTDWQALSLSELIDILHRKISSQRSESIRALYDCGEFELVHPYTR